MSKRQVTPQDCPTQLTRDMIFSEMKPDIYELTWREMVFMMKVQTAPILPSYFNFDTNTFRTKRNETPAQMPHELEPEKFYMMGQWTYFVSKEKFYVCYTDIIPAEHDATCFAMLNHGVPLIDALRAVLL